jgi:uncharacterized SAM-binding protein YcdF (DUF218 family)
VKPPKKRRVWLRRAVLLTLLALAVGAYLARGFLLTHAATFLDVSEPPRRADYAQVLGGGDDTRPFVAAALVKAGLTDVVLVPRTQRSPDVADGLTPPEEEVIRRVLVARGVPEGRIVLLDGECASTRDEAAALARFLDAHPGATVNVVTNAYHTRRARATFRAALGERAGAVRFVAAPTDGFDAGSWWRHEAGVTAYADEYAKLLAGWLGG